jgi:GT2 family glycosyltransferase
VNAWNDSRFLQISPGISFVCEPQFAVIMPNWNGEAFIERCLGSAMSAARGLTRQGVDQLEWIITDDASEDASPAIIQDRFPAVRLIRFQRNRGFARSVNLAMETCRAEWVFLLNNDLVLSTDCLSRLVDTLQSHSGGGELFSIGAQTLDWSTREPNHGGQNAAWKGGMIIQQAFQADKAKPSDFVQAGACLVNRRKFLEMGGFSRIYHPGYWEDYDLSFQALRRGWVNLYEPRAIAWHCGRGSMRRLLGDWGLSMVMKRNQLLFQWSNILERRMLLTHLLSLPGTILLGDHETGECGWGRALLEALPRLKDVFRLRRSRRDGAGLTAEREILQRFGQAENKPEAQRKIE